LSASERKSVGKETQNRNKFNAFSIEAQPHLTLLTSPPLPPGRPVRSRTIRLLETVLSFFSIPPHSCSCLPSLYTPRRQTLLPMLLRSLSLFLSASASVLAQTQVVYDSAHNTTSIGGTWSSGSRNVTTGPVGVFKSRLYFPVTPYSSLFNVDVRAAKHQNLLFPYEYRCLLFIVRRYLSVCLSNERHDIEDRFNLYSDESTGWFEVLRYRMTGNGAYALRSLPPGKFTLQPNGSISLYPLADGFQRIQQPCAANSDFTETYQDQELYQSWQIFTDPVDGPKLHMFGFDGSPVSPQYQISTTPAMLPLQLLYNATATNATTIIQRRSNDAAPSPIHRWNFATAVATVTAMLGGALLI
jgi:hypothetical protein